MPDRRAALLLSYAIVSRPQPDWISAWKPLQIEITYASGIVETLKPLFLDPEVAHIFIARVYPDLVGKVTSVDRPGGNAIVTK